MVQVKHGWEEQIALSGFKKEATYDAGVAMTAAEAFSLDGFDATVEWPDTIETDKGEVTGKEHGNDQEKIESMVNITINETHAKPNTLAACASLVMGSTVPTQDAALQAFKHLITPIAVGSALPSISVQHKKGGVQHKYDGVKGDSISITGEAGGAIQLSCEMQGSGTRTVDATGFAASISESWMLLNKCRVFMENGTNISISPDPPSQSGEDISSGTPIALAPRIKSFTWKFMNNLERQHGFGNSGLATDIDKGKRAVELTFDLLFNDIVEINHFLNQDPMAVEFQLAGGVIDSGGAFFFGFELKIPRFKLKSAPLPQGGVDDALTMTMDCEVFDDGTNAVSILDVYTGQAAYVA